jgi:hypothetical protein
VVTQLPPVTNGQITVSGAPGIGLELHPDVFKRTDYRCRSTTARELS